jgi:hypothetical protein
MRMVFFSKIGDAVSKGASDIGDTVKSGKGGNVSFNPFDGKGVKVATKESSDKRGDNEALYIPVNPPKGAKFSGLFSKDPDHMKGFRGEYQWPRAALTFVEYGEKLPCWTIKARIWTSSSHSTNEEFKTCANSQMIFTNDLGKEVTPSYNWDGMLSAVAGVITASRVTNTGSNRTTGPNPPNKLYPMDAGSIEMNSQLESILLRVMFVSGQTNPKGLDMSSKREIESFRDSRMWIAGFDPEGNRDKK